jgi:hypothetical protein
MMHPPESHFVGPERRAKPVEVYDNETWDPRGDEAPKAEAAK